VWPGNGIPQFVIPEGGPEGGGYYNWYEFPVGWPPSDMRRFAAGQEQFFDWPECDPFCFDDGGASGVETHTWFGYDGVWSKAEEPNNLMLRVVAGYYGAVAPTSLGRIKALYQ
jgi:hypothetical protein